MFLLLIGAIRSLPIELIDIRNNHAELLIDTYYNFSLSLQKNADIDHKEGWKSVYSYKPSQMSGYGDTVYVKLPNNMDHKKYYCFKLRTGGRSFFSKSFFFDEEQQQYVFTSEYVEHPRRMNDSKKEKEDKEKKDKTNDTENDSFNDMIINVGILLTIIVLILIILCFAVRNTS